MKQSAHYLYSYVNYTANILPTIFNYPGPLSPLMLKVKIKYQSTLKPICPKDYGKILLLSNGRCGQSDTINCVLGTRFELHDLLRLDTTEDDTIMRWRLLY